MIEVDRISGLVALVLIWKQPSCPLRVGTLHRSESMPTTSLIAYGWVETFEIEILDLIRCNKGLETHDMPYLLPNRKGATTMPIK